MPPAALGDYLRDFDALMAEYGFTGLPYGHFGDGCLHIRIDFPLDKPGGARVFREFLMAAAGLVAGYGGSLSGEHGDGRARGELLPTMYSAEAIAVVRRGQERVRPAEHPQPRCDRRPAAARRGPSRAGARSGAGTWRWRITATGGDFTQAVHRCTGVGKCRADNAATGGVMCPSYLATREEKDSTRGRARVLAGDGQRLDRHRWLAIPGGARGARPVPVVQGLYVGLPDRYRHGLLQGRGAPSELQGPGASRCRITPWAGCRAGRRWRRWRRAR